MKKKLFIFISVFLFFVYSNVVTEDDKILQYEDFDLSTEALINLIKNGLAGDVFDGIYVFNYYAYSVCDIYKGNEWTEFLAEEDFEFFQWKLSRILINLKENQYSKTRSLYWIFLAAKNGDRNAKISIERENLKLESSYSALLVEDICNKKDSMLSDYEIKILIDYALRGGKKEAHRLYEYYQNYMYNETKAIYWLRIGAQNFNDLSQYEYGKYLLGTKDENNNIRGSFWIKKAAKNGNVRAKELLKKLEEDEDSVILISQIKTFNLETEELINLIKKALGGNIEAGMRVNNYYALSVFDYTEELKWIEFLAEANLPSSQYTMGYYLNYDNKGTEYEKARSLYWIFLAAKNGEECSQNIIKDKNLKLESFYPALEENIYKKENDKISDYEIEVLIDYALRGGKKEAYRLYEYYKDYKKDETEAIYWLRIGAQNMSEKCQYEYGKYLLASEDEYKKIRGKFWVKKTANNGNEAAKKLLKEIGENEE
ncbi:sel1 repeat family protein [Treponema pedis]|uniref:Sel1 repeat family protein n=1 Tax=Treponema pedis TaxID=409322 RepID=A0A7S6WRT4_9SPIR|nr:sel1 repeat family protein [Treponema pedis]QOW61622.1 sel1 repeat family protein [Treponema pedis]